MTPRTLNTIFIALTICLAMPAWSHSKDDSPARSQITEIPLSDLKAVESKQGTKTRSKKKTSAKARKKQSVESQTASEHKLFERAVKAYRQDNCVTALGLLDRYLADYPGSPQAADANLFKADCYLKLSAE